MTVMAIRTSGTNADLIADAAELGYLSDDWNILDATWGKGNFWTKWQPRHDWYLTTNDLYVPEAEFNYDFRAFPPEWEERFQAVVFDPPYKLQGTSSNAGPASSNAAYGMDREYMPVKDHRTLVREGLTECWRVLKPGHFLLYKTMDMVVSGHVEWQTFDALDSVDDYELHAESRAALIVRGFGGKLVDWLMLMGHRAQPVRTRKCPACGGRAGEMTYVDGAVHAVATRLCETCGNTGRVPSPQQHSARNYSSLLVFRKGRR